MDTRLDIATRLYTGLPPLAKRTLNQQEMAAYCLSLADAFIGEHLRTTAAGSLYTKDVSRGYPLWGDAPEVPIFVPDPVQAPRQVPRPAVQPVPSTRKPVSQDAAPRSGWRMRVRCKQKAGPESTPGPNTP